MRRAQNTDNYALKQHRLSQNISPVCSSFVLVIASGMHLVSESEKRVKNVGFHSAKNIQNTTNTFSLFSDKFLENDLQPIYCSLTCEVMGKSMREEGTGLYTSVLTHDSSHYCLIHRRAVNVLCRWGVDTLMHTNWFLPSTLPCWRMSTAQHGVSLFSGVQWKKHFWQLNI